MRPKQEFMEGAWHSPCHTQAFCKCHKYKEMNAGVEGDMPMPTEGTCPQPWD